MTIIICRVQYSVQFFYTSANALNSAVVSKYAALKKVLIKKINTLIWIHCGEGELIEDKRKDKVQRAHTSRNPKGTSNW